MVYFFSIFKSKCFYVIKDIFSKVSFVKINPHFHSNRFF